MHYCALCITGGYACSCGANFSKSIVQPPTCDSLTRNVARGRTFYTSSSAGRYDQGWVEESCRQPSLIYWVRTGPGWGHLIAWYSSAYGA